MFAEAFDCAAESATLITGEAEAAIQIQLIADGEIPAARLSAGHRQFGDARMSGNVAFPTGTGQDRARAVAWVAKTDGYTAGFAFGWAREDEFAHFGGFRVHARFRDRDIGLLLARAALAHARGLGCLKVVYHDLPLATLTPLVMESGYTFSRTCGCRTGACQEFYLDLYAGHPRRSDG